MLTSLALIVPMKTEIFFLIFFFYSSFYQEVDSSAGSLCPQGMGVPGRVDEAQRDWEYFLRTQGKPESLPVSHKSSFNLTTLSICSGEPGEPGNHPQFWAICSNSVITSRQAAPQEYINGINTDGGRFESSTLHFCSCCHLRSAVKGI